VSFDPREIVVPTTERETHQVNEPFLASGQMSSQAQQALAVLTKAVESDGHRPAIGPQHFIALKENIASMTILSGVATKKNS
jgi:hypothetical protein